VSIDTAIKDVRFLARREMVKLDKNAYWVAELGYRTPQEVLSEYLSRQKPARVK
jgi:hypothetical protein